MWKFSLIDRQGMPRFLRSPCTHPEKGKEQLLGPVTQVEDDVDRIQTLLKETFFFQPF